MKKISELDNGLRIVTHRMPEVESVTFGVWNDVGSRDETEDINGTAHFLEHMAFKGTKSKTAFEIMQRIENVGGYINAYTSEEITAYWTRLLSENLSIGVDIISDILQNSTFESKELERERGVILQEIGMYLDDPGQMVGDYWQRTAFPDQPVGRLIIGKKEIIKSIKREKIVEFMENYYHPKKMVVSAAGKINHDDFVDQIANSMLKLPNGKKNNRVKASYAGGEYREEKELEQVHLVMGFKGLDYYDKDRDALRVYSALMGAGGSSRLFQEIREKRGLVYGIYAGINSFADNGTFQVVAGTGKNEIKELMPVLCEELTNSPENLSEEEIEKGKAQLKASILMGMESSQSNAMKSAYQLLRYKRLIDNEEQIKSINEVSKKSIERVVKKLLNSNPTIASIGPVENLETIDKIKLRFN
ncbi:MAG: putative zinc protease [Alphaproteobacteria bacterium MarineAlpha5_Bin11]|nr:MAG: putative zinc protease [Alphaproteobacteria bacterium MarineAlpha5_Bin11]PPR52203.1 MAG: putative zinc protease [Alphaproteobacteria bacterium MarineAlpha5_Bin10]|tara:strand:+ start:106049 stop:107302 length:1254 start_codon:yes stop_codon:yes gene_type:complete